MPLLAQPLRRLAARPGLMPNRVRVLLLLATLGGLGGCGAAIAARQERLQNDAAAMRSTGAPKDYRELVQVALRRHLARPDTFAGGLIGRPGRAPRAAC